MSEQPNTLPILNSDSRPWSLFIFQKDGKEVGCFDFGKSPIEFTGDADESAKIFVEAVRSQWGSYEPNEEVFIGQCRRFNGVIHTWVGDRWLPMPMPTRNISCDSIEMPKSWTYTNPPPQKP